MKIFTLNNYTIKYIDYNRIIATLFDNHKYQYYLNPIWHAGFYWKQYHGRTVLISGWIETVVLNDNSTMDILTVFEKHSDYQYDKNEIENSIKNYLKITTRCR